MIKVSSNSRKSVLKLSKDYLIALRLNKNKLVVIWKLSDISQEVISTYYDQKFSSFQMVLRIYNVSRVGFKESNKEETYLQEVFLEKKQLLSIIHSVQENCSYITELGLMMQGQKFFPLLRSNLVHLSSFPLTLEHKKKIENFFLTKEAGLPDWEEYVSTYSYYDNKNKSVLH